MIPQRDIIILCIDFQLLNDASGGEKGFHDHISGFLAIYSHVVGETLNINVIRQMCFV